MDEYIECPYCRKLTPALDLNCIHCAEALPEPVGMLSSMRYSFRWIMAFIALAVIISFIAFSVWV